MLILKDLNFTMDANKQIEDMLEGKRKMKEETKKIEKDNKRIDEKEM